MPTPKPPLAPNPLPPDRRPSRGIFARAVGSFVPKLAAKAFERYGFHSAEIMAEWPRVVGQEVAAFTKPERIKWPRAAEVSDDGISTSGGATLVLQVEPARALDVEYRSGEIIDRINRYFGYRAIGQLRIVQAPLDADLDGGAAASRPGIERHRGGTAHLEPAPLPPGADPALQRVLEQLWSSIGAQRRRG